MLSSPRLVTWPSLSRAASFSAHGLTVQLAILDTRVGGFEVARASRAVHFHQQAAHVGIRRHGRSGTQKHLGTRRGNHLPVGSLHGALVDHGRCNQHHPALAARRDARALEYLDETARTFELRARLLGGQKGIEDEAVVDVQAAGGKAVEIHLG